MVKVEGKTKTKQKNIGEFINFAEIVEEYAICIIGLGGMDALLIYIDNGREKKRQ